MKNSIVEAHTVDDLEKLEFFARDAHQMLPFQSELLLFCEKLSEKLFEQEDIKQFPDFVALAFWLRKANLHRMHDEFRQKMTSNTPLKPRGIVFHIPPSNIEVMLVYSWICSLLVGNANIIRIPGANTQRLQKLLEIILEVLCDKKLSQISETTCFLRYHHENEITAWISSKADVRVIWGGDETVNLIRQIPMKPDAKDIVFPDRFSYAALEAKMFLDPTQEQKVQIIVNFFNDVYWFEQSACSSPRILFWVGDTSAINQASNAFYQMLQSEISKRHYEISLSGFMLKQTYMFNQALTLPVKQVMRFSNELSILILDSADEGCRIHCGRGLLYHVALKNLNELASFVTDKDQTLTYFGFSSEEIQRLVTTINGKGLTRLVPFGRALDFHPVWDGQDLFLEFTTEVVLS